MVDQNKNYRVSIDASGMRQGASDISQAVAKIKTSFQEAGTSGKELDNLAASAARRTSSVAASLDTEGKARQRLANLQRDLAIEVAGGYKTMQAAEDLYFQASAKWDPAIKQQIANLSALRAAQAQASFNQVLGVAEAPIPGSMAGQSAAAFAPSLEAEARLQAFTAKYEPLVAAQERYTKAVAANRAMVEAGEITEERYAAALRIEQASLDAVTAAQIRSSKAGGGSLLGLNNIGRMELQASAINFVQGISAGISPLRMLETEVPQVFGAFIQGGFKVTGAMLGVGGAVAAIAAGLGALFIAYEKGASQTAAFNAAIRLTADASGMTRNALDSMVASVTKYGQLGPSTARAIATEMTASGKLSSDVIGKLLSVTEGFAQATGQDAQKAGADLTKMFTDPQQALKQLDDQYNLLSVSQRRHIDDLIAEGQRTQAQIALADALGSRFQHLANQDMGVLEKSWAGIGRAASDAWDKMLNVGRGQSLEQQLAGLEAQLANAKAGAAQLQQAGGLLNLIPGGNSQLATDQSGIAALESKIAALKSTISGQDLDAKLAKQKADLQDLGKQADDAAQGYGSFATKQKEAAEAVTKWTDALVKLKAGALTAEDTKSIKDAEAAIKSAETALAGAKAFQNSLRSPEQESQDRLAIARRVAAAPPTQRAALQARLTAEDQAAHNPDASVQGASKQFGDAAATESLLQQTTALRDQNTQLDLNARLTLATGEAWMKSSTEGAMAAARQQASIEALTQRIDVNARTRQILNQQVNDAVTSGAQQVRSLDDQAAAQQRLAIAAKDGPLSEHQAEITNQIAAATQTYDDKLKLALSTGNTKAAANLKLEIAGIGDRIRRADVYAVQAARSIQMFTTLEDQGYQKRLLQVQLDNVFANDNQQAKALAMAQAEVDLLKMKVDLNSEQAAQYRQNIADIAEMNIRLTQQKAIAAELPNAFNQAFDRIGEAVTQFAVQGGDAFKSLENIGNAVFSELLQEGLKLALINPVKNWFNGDNALPTFDSVADHLFGSNFSGSNSQVGVRNQSTGGFDLSSGGGSSWLSGVGSWIGGIGSSVGSWLGSFFADGGVMTSHGKLPLRTYSDGGITSSPQLAMFGEGSTPEAYVPVPSGRIPVEIRNFQPNPAANGNWQPVINQHLHFHTKEAVNQFRQSPGQTMNAAYRSLMAAGARN